MFPEICAPDFEDELVTITPMKAGHRHDRRRPADMREDPDSLVIKMPFEQREELMAADPETYYITDHYRDYPWMLVRLSAVRRDASVKPMFSGAFTE